MVIGNLLIGATFYALGRLRRVSAIIGVSQLTLHVHRAAMLTARCTLHDPLSARPQFVPASVISGFLSCIGYKVPPPLPPPPPPPPRHTHTPSSLIPLVSPSPQPHLYPR